MSDTPERLVIDSDTAVSDVDRHFRVSAGPGAGKTRWLIRHLGEVLLRSKRVSTVSRVACISFTNVAVQEIQRRLGPGASQVEVSTIHSFLYRNVVKPYLHVLTDDSGKPHVPTALVDGHDEHRQSYQKFKQWVTEQNGGWLFASNMRGICSTVQSQVAQVRWRWVDDKEGWQLCVPHPEWLGTKKVRALCSPDNLLQYKRLYWSEGKLDHDDVLYFAHRILDGHPLIRECLSARYRHLFIDEFQDTTPAQTHVVRWLAECGTVVGVIGDAEQSIYAFLDAQPSHFSEFALPGFLDVVIADNWRSSEQIVRVLNKVRTDGLQQASLRKVEGERVRMLLGSVPVGITKAVALLPPSTQPWFLTREHAETPQFREPTNVGMEVWDKFLDIDRDRARFVQCLTVGIVLARLGQHTLAIDAVGRGIGKRRELRAPLKLDGTSIERHALAVILLERLLPNYEGLHNGTVYNFYQAVSEVLEQQVPQVSLKKLTRGESATFCANTPFKALVSSIKLVDESRTVRVIHQTKGSQADAVVVKLSSEQIDAMIGAEQGEERRLIYVAMSRARDHLVLLAESATETQIRGIGLLGIECLTH